MAEHSGNVVGRIRTFNQPRQPDMLANKFAKMRKDAFAFFRGTCHLFYQDWSPAVQLDEAPLSLVSGDLHRENFGAYNGENGLACFSVNYFDEAALAPFTRVLWRFVAGLLVGFSLLAR